MAVGSLLGVSGRWASASSQAGWRGGSCDPKVQMVIRALRTVPGGPDPGHPGLARLLRYACFLTLVPTAQFPVPACSMTLESIFGKAVISPIR